MIKEALQYLVGMSDSEQIDVGEREFIKDGYNAVKQPTVDTLSTHTLASLVDYLKADPDAFGVDNMFLHVVSPSQVSIVSDTFGDGDKQRETILTAKLQQDIFGFNSYHDAEEFIIGLQALFVQSETTANIIKLAGNLVAEQSVSVQDDGMTQTVTAKQGITRVAQVDVPNPVTLHPFRTFQEIDQPASPFVLRIRKGRELMECALFQADGGVWKNAAIKSIKEYLTAELGDVKVTILA